MLWKRRLKNPCLLSTLLLLGSLCLVSGCTEKDQPRTIKEQGTLRIVSRNGPSTYFEDRTGATGFEYELARLFAEHLDVDLEVTVLHSLEEIFQSLEDNNVHLAAAGLTITEERQKQLNFSPAYMEIKQYVLYRAGTKRPRSPEHLVGSKITVMAKSSHNEILNRLKPDYPELNWRTATDVETVDLLDMLSSSEIDYTILDSNEYLANRGFYPRLNIAFEIGQPGQLAWALPGTITTPGLIDELATFFKKIKDNGTLRQLEERFYSHSEQVNRIGSLTFNQAVEQRLPKYKNMIEAIAIEYGIDWRLLAAISYQESHWNPRARSPTGVRGMMMLTLPTAKEMGIKNRLDAEQSLRGGARYFNKILRRLPDRVKEPDRTWFALAAYNVGMGHLEDARKITERRGGNPSKWADVKDNLPLLSKRRWYKGTKHGYARGNEPVTYVQNIRHFYNLLNWTDVAKNRTPPPQQVEQYIPESLRRNIKPL
ncbi:MAG: membrane-bound lytic murein transglycosylase MltF [Oceanicoccus sp.]|nr:membrane-bound lytic murein transglycosylase MltF [Oceanicoccus sp.]